MGVELLELAVIDPGMDQCTTFLFLRSVEHGATEDKCPTGNEIPTFERIGIGQFKVREEAEVYFQCTPSTIMLI